MAARFPKRRAQAFCVQLIPLALIIALSLPGCDLSNYKESAIVRDSAGIAIIESIRPAWNDAERWVTSSTPILEIGTSEGSTQYQFFQIEGVLRLPDGGIVVADGGANEIRFFDSSGIFISQIGGEGDAPGEYRMLSALGYGPGDSLWAYDYGNRRFTVITRDGEIVRTVSVGGWLSAVGAVGRLSDGSFVVKEGWGSGQSRTPSLGLIRDPIAIALASPDGSSWDTVGMFPGREVFVSLDGGRRVMSAPLFSHNTSATIWGGHVVVGTQESMEVVVFSVDGRVTRIFRIRGENLNLNARDIEQRRTDILNTVPDAQRIEMARGIDMMDVPRTRPAFGQILVATDESIWLAEEVRYPDIPTEWTVIGSNGHLLGEITVPEGFFVYQAGVDWVLGVGRDELDVEYVRMYRIRR